MINIKRHCEECFSTRKQSIKKCKVADCFVASLLAMTWKIKKNVSSIGAGISCLAMTFLANFKLIKQIVLSILLLLLILPFIFCGNCSAVPQRQTQKIQTLKGGVSVTKELPDSLYGTWTVISTIVETNNPELFKKESVDIWTLSKQDGIITLSNPISGAVASITVEEAGGNRAAFVRQEITESETETERPEIIVDGDSFYGYDMLTIIHYKNDKFVKKDVVKYKLEGKKLSGQTLQKLFK